MVLVAIFENVLHRYILIVDFHHRTSLNNKKYFNYFLWYKILLTIFSMEVFEPISFYKSSVVSYIAININMVYWLPFLSFHLIVLNIRLFVIDNIKIYKYWRQIV